MQKNLNPPKLILPVGTDVADSELFTAIELARMKTMLKKDGKLSRIKIISYWNWFFVISFSTPHYKGIVSTGGNPDSIRDFNPLGGWAEWDSAGIFSLQCTPKS